MAFNTPSSSSQAHSLYAAPDGLRRGFRAGLTSTLTLTLALAFAAVTVAPSEAKAEGVVSASGKGIVGGTLLGGEVALLITSAVGSKAWWPYALFGVAGAGAGAAGGYFVEQQSAVVTEPSLYMLAGGMALIIPTIVAVSNASAYEPSDEAEADEETIDSDSPDIEGGVSLETGALPYVPRGLFGIDAAGASADGRAALVPGVPMPMVIPATRASGSELASAGEVAVAEVQIPIFSGRF